MRLRDGWDVPPFSGCTLGCQSTKSTHRRFQVSDDRPGVGPDAPRSQGVSIGTAKATSTQVP